MKSWLSFLITRILSYGLWLVLPLYYFLFFFRIRPGGTFLPYYLFDRYDEVYNSVFYGARHGTSISAHLIYWISAIIGILLFLLVLAAVLVIPFYLIAFITNYFGIVSRDFYNDYCYQKEERLGQPHQKRETGAEWDKRKEQEAEEYKKEKERKKKEKEEAEERAREEEARQSSNWWDRTEQWFEDEDNNQSNRQSYSNINTGTGNLSELEKAKIAFFLDGVNLSTVTEEQLKKTRNKLMKDFHPDGNDDQLSTEYSKKINRYYQLLKEQIR